PRRGHMRCAGSSELKIGQVAGAFAAPPPSLRRRCRYAPDILRILPDRAIRRKEAAMRRVPDCHCMPAPLVLPERIYFSLRGRIGIEIARHHEPVMIIETPDKVTISVGIIGREHTR